ncbi:MAG: methanogenesis marker 14 protein [Methanosarcina sp.]|jgi:putative methanogenesis marker protein 14|nr:methanogenesis marker 14 protein [Methanosarcina sp.]MDD3315988.1 methanogenesis marker 14 protein [Methanosarcina sp.]MDD4304966.1 methanogenesis marker 14 protein [Methanosarcina sp.]MDD4620120.1 methanogenesis marker 14 protein [Methanosarcina sp.]NLN43724.1 methanogenesis marker 14 protein [Methanosarcina sp.]
MALKPRITKSPPVRLIDLKSKPFFIVASVEVGNTTTKSILTATNMETGRTHIINKVVRMTRDVRPPKLGEVIFGKTLTDVELTREAVAELVRDTLTESMEIAGLDIKTDLDFVVRSTGVVAGFDSPDDIGEFIKALADGCLIAGVPPKNMTPPMSVSNIPKRLQKFSKLEQVIFDGAVAGVVPPIGATGVEIVANEMEGELATAGIKEAAKLTDVDFRSPCISIDFGTTLDGRITNSDHPYAKTIGNFCGYAGAIPDAIIRGSKVVDSKVGTALDVFEKQKPPSFFTLKLRAKAIEAYAKRINELIIIEKVPKDRKKYGSVPVRPDAAEEIGVTLIGCDVGVNGSDMGKLSAIGMEICKTYGLPVVYAVIDEVMAGVVCRLIKVAKEERLVFEDTTIGITGRAGITGNKPKLILKCLDEMNLASKIDERVVFVDDGLARGAAVMARCMNSLGTPRNPLGGRHGGKCILAHRIKLQNK